jgi:hypothetical protein
VRYDVRKGVIQEQLRQATAREDLLSHTLLDLEMKVIVQFGKSMIAAVP